MNDELKIKFWGVRGSYPAPGAETVKYGGNTSCVEICAGGRTIILDAGTGIIPLGRELAKRAAQRPLELILLFSHLHLDHAQGFPFFVPAYMPNTRLHIFGPGGTPETLKQVLEHNQSAETFPLSLRDMSAAKTIESVRESQAIIWDEENVRVVGSASGSGLSPDAVVIRIHKSHAHPGGVFVYRITWRGRSVVYATDTEGYVGVDRKLAAFARNADVLIHDAQYCEEHYGGQLTGFPSTQGFGHSTAAMACEVAASAATGELVLFHHDPSYADSFVAAQEVAAQKLFPNSHAAHEGMEIKFPLTPIPLPMEGERRMDVKYVKND